MGTFFAVGVLCLVLWIVVSLMRASKPGDIVTGYYVWPGEFVETGRERRADATPSGKPEDIRRIEILGEGEWR